MKTAFAYYGVISIAAQLLLIRVQSFQVTPRLNNIVARRQHQQPLQQQSLHPQRVLFSGSGGDEAGEEELDPIFLEPGSDEFSAEQWKDIEAAQPSEVAIMKDLLGVNIFTYLLAFLIIVFTGLNVTLGPGWLGGTLGIQGTGSIEEVSPSLPDTMDLNREEFLL